MNWLLTKLINPTLAKRTINQRLVRDADEPSPTRWQSLDVRGYPLYGKLHLGPTEEIDIYYVSAVFNFFGRSYSMIFGAGGTPEQAWDIANQSVSLWKLCRLSWPHVISRKRRIGPFKLYGNLVDPLTLRWSKSARRHFVGKSEKMNINAAIADFRRLQSRRRD